MQKIILGVAAVALLGAVGFQLMNKPSVDVTPLPPVETTALGTAVDSAMPVPGNTVPEMVVTDVPATEATPAAAKEFTMTAYYDEKGKWFSVKEMTVKKGDLVRVKVTNTKGMHDFVIDEMEIKKELPLNQEVVIEFTADKVGDFVYYCSKPGHRAGGQWGTLKVTE